MEVLHSCTDLLRAVVLLCTLVVAQICTSLCVSQSVLVESTVAEQVVMGRLIHAAEFVSC